MKTQINNEQVWREYVKRNLVFWGLLVGFVPGIVLITEVGRLLGQSEVFGLTIFAWMAALIGAGFWRTSWRCPRCRKRFYYKWWYGNSFALKCVHCGFRPHRDR